MRVTVAGRLELTTLVAATLEEAYAEGREALRLAKQGISPGEYRTKQKAEQRAEHTRLSRQDTTLGAAVAAFLVSPELADVRPRTRGDLLWSLNSPHVKPLHGVRLTAISRGDREGVRAEGKTTTWRKLAGAPKRLYSYAMAHEWVEKSPAYGIKLPSPKTRAQPFIVTGERPDWSLLVPTIGATEAYEARCVAKGYATQYGDLWHTQMFTGLRAEAVERLEARHFHDAHHPRRSVEAQAGTRRAGE